MEYTLDTFSEHLLEIVGNFMDLYGYAFDLFEDPEIVSLNLWATLDSDERQFLDEMGFDYDVFRYWVQNSLEIHERWFYN